MSCRRGCPDGECYCPSGSEPRDCGHGPGGSCERCGGCYDCDACSCGEDGGAAAEAFETAEYFRYAAERLGESDG